MENILFWEKCPAGEGLDPFGDLRAYYGFYIGHPGKKLLFMGQEFAQEREWSENRELDWFLLSEPKHLGMQRYMHSLYEIYREYPALYELDYEPGGFQWMDPDDAEESIVSFARFGRNGKNLLFVINFTPVERKEYRLGTPGGGSYELLLDSSWKNSAELEKSSTKSTRQKTSPPARERLLSLTIFRAMRQRSFPFKRNKKNALVPAVGSSGMGAFLLIQYGCYCVS